MSGTGTPIATFHGARAHTTCCLCAPTEATQGEHAGAMAGRLGGPRRGLPARSGASLRALRREGATTDRPHSHAGPPYARARTERTASIMCSSAGSASSQRRVLRPQSGLTHSRSRPTCAWARSSSRSISSADGTRGEWMS
jgi:hypothetical protein